VIDHLHGDLAGRRSFKRPTLGRVERRPGILINFRLQRGLKALVWVISTQKIGVSFLEGGDLGGIVGMLRRFFLRGNGGNR
jgi:hypothetical protein